MGHMRKAICWLVIPLLSGGCTGSSTIGGQLTDSGADDLSFMDGPTRDQPVLFTCDTVDILFVIDNSNSMAQEQQNLIDNFPRFIQRVESIDPPLESYRVGVISTDIGAGPYTGEDVMGTCKPGGDEGKLQHAPVGEGCTSSYPRFLEGPAPSLAQDFACIAQLGVGGCGYEQQMEAALRALTAQPYNDGFMRINAPLAIIFVTDEDDCSAADSTLFDPNDMSLGPYPTRCVQHLGKLHPVTRYIEAFKGLKAKVERLVVAAITGPPGTVEIDPIKNTVLPVCSSSSFGSASPGNRFSKLIAGFGDRGVMGNLCTGDLAQPLDLIGKAIEHACLQ